MTLVHFRPSKDDVVVYCPARNEIRVHAATKAERELYVRVFGHRLCGDPLHFSERKAYTLQPLAESAREVMTLGGIPGLDRVVLREIEWRCDNGFNEVVVHRADDLLAATARRGNEALVPEGVDVVRAVFDFHFTGCAKPRRIQVGRAGRALPSFAGANT